ncbi:MAG: class I SAM-dependent methyltransferase [Sandaracinus sp.]|nr:class I SAM-dependent methyltransferase [Sandaracinus sp.]MCB9624486.1 class I SAM-dependent methyltransferase [Sandaracinus sp.]MCB9630968.1 class I SAM-dependent methyltransferase [Sandaracinus sp.]
MREGEPSLTSTLVALGRAYAPRDRDIYAERLAGGPWRRLARAAERPLWRRAVRELSLGFVDHLALRTATLDAFVRDAVRAGAEQVVILGAGLDARAWRLGLDVPFFEVDHPSTQALKRRRVPSDATFVPVDFTRDDLESSLASAGHRADARTAWVWEGVTMYLPREAVDGTLGIVARRSAKGSMLALTYLDPDAVPATSLVRVGFRALFGEPLEAGYAPNAMQTLLAAHGFVVRFDADSRGWNRAMGGDPRRAVLVRGERLAVAERVG